MNRRLHFSDNRADKTLTLDLTTEAGRQAARLYAGWLIIMEPPGESTENEEWARDLFEWIDELDAEERDMIAEAAGD